MALLHLDVGQIFGCVIILLGLRLTYELSLSPLRAYPGPFLARFTDLWRAWLTTRGNVDSHQREWHQKHGSAVRVGPNTLSLNDPSLIKVIYTTKNAWIKSDMYKPNDALVEGQRIQNIFNTPDKAFHDRYCRPIVSMWSLSRVLELEPLLDETISLFMNKLAASFTYGSDAGRKVCMMDDWLAYFSWDAVANMSFAKHYGMIEQGSDVQGMIAESTAGLHYFAPVSQAPWLDNWLDKNPIWRIGPRPLVNGFLYTAQVLGQYQQDLANGVAATKSKGVDTWMDRYLGMKETRPDLVDDTQALRYLMLNVLAGGDSTAGAMRSIIYHLGRNPVKYEKMVAELKEARLPLPVSWKNIPKLPYFEACIWEAARISPSLGLLLERWVPIGGLQLPDGRFIPAGTKVGINPAVVTRNAEVFGDDVDDFNPDRWLQIKGETDQDFRARRVRMQEVTDLMFGAGNRACLGKSMAKMMIYKLFATLYSTFDVKLTDPNHEWKYWNSWFIFQKDIPMTLTRRD